MKIHESLDNLKATLSQANDMLKISEQSLDLVMRDLIKTASPEQIKSIQTHVVELKTLLTSAKKGENIDLQVKSISKRILNER